LNIAIRLLIEGQFGKPVSGEEPPRAWVVKPILDIVFAGFPIVEVSLEHERVDLGHWAGGSNDFAEGA